MAKKWIQCIIRDMTKLYPLFFTPVYKDYIWGGRKILEIFHREGPPGKVAESWEVSGRQEGMSVVENGPLKGRSIHDLMLTEKKALMGIDSEHERFPLLLKIIDAQDNLSVQVHPSVGSEAKTESWFILNAEKDAAVYAGLNDHYPIEEIEEKLTSNEILSLMNTLPVKKGDMISIPGGRLHAIGSGTLLFEVQQCSNTTYRVYDWGRDRPLHIEEAKSVLLYEDSQNPIATPKLIDETPTFCRYALLKTDFFVIEKLELKGSQNYQKLEDKCEMVFCLEGENTLCPVGRTCLIPASSEVPKIETEKTSLLRIYLP
jgi:mannose-6-phosphate isomerase